MITTRLARQKLAEILSDPIFNKLDLSEYLARQYTLECIENIIEIIRDKDEKTATRLKAIDILLNRGWGKPAVAIKLSSDDKDKENSKRFIEGELEEAERKSKEIMELMKLGGQAPDNWNTNGEVLKIEN